MTTESITEQPRGYMVFRDSQPDLVITDPADLITRRISVSEGAIRLRFGDEGMERYRNAWVAQNMETAAS